VAELQLVIEDLPAGFDALRAEALVEGYRFVERLAADWRSRAIRFDSEGEALLAAHVSGVLAGIGGITIEPVLPGAVRMRRFYVRPAFRRSGVGFQLATALLARMIPGRLITVKAVPASFPFGSRSVLRRMLATGTHISSTGRVGDVRRVLPVNSTALPALLAVVGDRA
jgi:GNAT superfamily N-acetyltransferase